jgi:hypothetical protein
MSENAGPFLAEFGVFFGLPPNGFPLFKRDSGA